jgi:hypothetical protein
VSKSDKALMEAFEGCIPKPYDGQPIQHGVMAFFDAA